MAEEQKVAETSASQPVPYQLPSFIINNFYSSMNDLFHLASDGVDDVFDRSIAEARVSVEMLSDIRGKTLLFTNHGTGRKEDPVNKLEKNEHPGITEALQQEEAEIARIVQFGIQGSFSAYLVPLDIIPREHKLEFEVSWRSSDAATRGTEIKLFLHKNGEGHSVEYIWGHVVKYFDQFIMKYPILLRGPNKSSAREQMKLDLHKYILLRRRGEMSRENRAALYGAFHEKIKVGMDEQLDLGNLLRYFSINNVNDPGIENMSSFKGYISRMKQNQGNCIYYITAGEFLNKRMDYEVIYMADHSDSPAIKKLIDSYGKKLVHEKQRIQKKNVERRRSLEAFCNEIKKYLKGMVEEVVVSNIIINPKIGAYMSSMKVMALNPGNKTIDGLIKKFKDEELEVQKKMLTLLLFENALFTSGISLDEYRDDFEKTKTKLLKDMTFQYGVGP